MENSIKIVPSCNDGETITLKITVGGFEMYFTPYSAELNLSKWKEMVSAIKEQKPFLISSHSADGGYKIVLENNIVSVFSDKFGSSGFNISFATPAEVWLSALENYNFDF